MHLCKMISSTFLTQDFLPDDSFRVSNMFCGECLGCLGELRSALEITVMSQVMFVISDWGLSYR